MQQTERGISIPVSDDFDKKVNMEAFGDAARSQNNSDELINLSQDLVSIPKFDLWPCHLDSKKVQKVIVNMNYTQYKTGENGVKFQYVRWLAYSMGVFYNHRLIYDRVPFVLEVPRKSFCNMFYRSASIEFGTLMQSLKTQHNEIPLLEIHFKKETPVRYILKFLAVVEYNGIVDDQYRWTRKRTMFKESSYSPKNMHIIKGKQE